MPNIRGRHLCVTSKATSNVVAEQLARFLPCYTESKGAYQVREESHIMTRAVKFSYTWGLLF